MPTNPTKNTSKTKITLYGVNLPQETILPSEKILVRLTYYEMISIYHVLPAYEVKQILARVKIKYNIHISLYTHLFIGNDTNKTKISRNEINLLPYEVKQIGESIIIKDNIKLPSDTSLPTKKIQVMLK